MHMTVTPHRYHLSEVLDDPNVPRALRQRSHRDIAVANAVFGGSRAVLGAIAECADTLPPHATLLDIGSGTGEATRLAERCCARFGVQLQTIALDIDAGLAASALRHAHGAICASALQLPLADASIDIVMCAQVAHHFSGESLTTLVREMHRVARHRVIICDLRRSWIAVAGLWAASWPLRFHPVSRHDGIVSILRGFTVAELDAVVYDSCHARATVRRRRGFRLTASWTPTPVSCLPAPTNRAVHA